MDSIIGEAVSSALPCNYTLALALQLRKAQLVINVIRYLFMSCICYVATNIPMTSDMTIKNYLHVIPRGTPSTKEWNTPHPLLVTVCIVTTPTHFPIPVPSAFGMTTRMLLLYVVIILMPMQDIFLFIKCPDWLWASPSPLGKGISDSFPKSEVAKFKKGFYVYVYLPVVHSCSYSFSQVAYVKLTDALRLSTLPQVSCTQN